MEEMNPQPRPLATRTLRAWGALAFWSFVMSVMSRLISSSSVLALVSLRVGCVGTICADRHPRLRG